MKELTIEEKARRYDEALERARKEYKNHEAFKGYCEMLEHIFTELKEKESEDEKIRKSLIILLQHFCKGYRVPGLDFSVSYKDMLVWLEKQGRKETSWKPSKEQIAALEHFVRSVGESGYASPYDSNTKLIFSLINDLYTLEKQELKKIEDKIEIPFGAKDSEVQEATYYIPSGFHVEIDGNKVVIKKGNQKPAWSKEDEEIYQSIIDDTVQENQLDNKQINWLKSLKSQKLCVYNPYKAVVESITKMCDKYENYMYDEKEAKDFLANVAIKCREAAEYDKKYMEE